MKQGALLMLSAHVTVTHTLTTGLSGMQILQEHSSSLLTLWVVWHQVLFLILKQDYEHAYQFIHLSTCLTLHSINARQWGYTDKRPGSCFQKLTVQ